MCLQNKSKNNFRKCYKPICGGILLLRQWKSGQWLTGGVCLCLHVCGCVLVGYWPSMSGKRCHSYINKPDRRDKAFGGQFLFFLVLGVQALKKREEIKLRALQRWKVVLHVCISGCIVFDLCVRVCVCTRVFVGALHLSANKKLYMWSWYVGQLHMYSWGLCPCFPVNTLFFSSSAEEWIRGQIGAYPSSSFSASSSSSSPLFQIFLTWISSVALLDPSKPPSPPFFPFVV